MGPSCFTVFLIFKVISLDKSIKEASTSSNLSWWFNISSVHHPSQPALTPGEYLKACIYVSVEIWHIFGQLYVLSHEFKGI